MNARRLHFYERQLYFGAKYAVIKITADGGYGYRYIAHSGLVAQVQWTAVGIA